MHLRPPIDAMSVIPRPDLLWYLFGWCCSGENVKIMVPLFDDENTDHTPEDGAGGTPGIYMDAMAFGMGCCCLQVTFQARDVGESRHLYDQLAVVAPVSFATGGLSRTLSNSRWVFLTVKSDQSPHSFSSFARR